MTRIDQFESAFLAASKELYQHRDVELRDVLLVTDLDDGQAYGERLRAFFARRSLGDVEQREIRAGDNISEVLGLVRESSPDLVVTYRNLTHKDLHRSALTHTLGSYVDVLTQATPVPVLLMPRPDEESGWEKAEGAVLALADQLTGDDRLVHYAAAFTPDDATLTLAHVEDERVFKRYLEVISKIPEIDTATAREEIERQLLKEPRDYIRSVRDVLEARGQRLNKVVTMGHRLAGVRRLAEEQQAGLLVLNTKDDDQDAMHGLAYPLAVELRQLPMLML